MMMILYQRWTFFCTLLCTLIEKCALFSRDQFRFRQFVLTQPARSPPFAIELLWRSLTERQAAVEVLVDSYPFSCSRRRRLKQRSDSKNCLYLRSPQGKSLLHPPHLAFSACASLMMNFSTGPSSTSLLSGFLQFLISQRRWLPSMYRSVSGDTPAIVSRSAIMLPLILMSSGESEFMEGDMLTSMSQGLRLESMSTSKPSTSQQLLLQGTFCRKEVQRMFSPERMVLTIRSSILAKSSLVSSFPTLKLRKSLRAVRLHLLPKYSSFSFSLFTNSVFFLLTLQLVRCWNFLFSQSLAFWSQLSVANLPSPSWQMQILSGFTPRSATQILRSNLRLLMRSGLPMQWLTMSEEYFSSLARTVARLVVTVMPLPCERLCGLAMQVVPGARAISSYRRESSCGRMKVLGRKLKWERPWRICILEMHLFMRSLRVRWKELGKWLIFWQGSSAWYVSIFITVDDQYSVQFLFVCAHLKPFSSSTFFMSFTAPFWNLQKQPISSCLAMLLISEKLSSPPFSTSSSYSSSRYSIPSISSWIACPSSPITTSLPDHGLNRRNLTALPASFWSSDLSPGGSAGSCLLLGSGRSSLALGLTISMSSSSSQSAYLSFYNIFLYTRQKQSNHGTLRQKRMQGWEVRTRSHPTCLKLLSEKKYQLSPRFEKAVQWPPLAVPLCTIIEQIQQRWLPGFRQWPCRSITGATFTSALFLLRLLLKRLRVRMRTEGGSLMQNFLTAFWDWQPSQVKQLSLPRYQGVKKVSMMLPLSLNYGQKRPYSFIQAFGTSPSGRAIFLLKVFESETATQRLKSTLQLILQQSKHSSRLAKQNPNIFQVMVFLRFFIISFRFCSPAHSFQPSIRPLSNTPSSYCASCWSMCLQSPLALHTQLKRDLGVKCFSVFLRYFLKMRLISPTLPQSMSVSKTKVSYRV